jgi:hypothetical protein
MFVVDYDDPLSATQEDVLGITTHKQFNIRFNLNRDKTEHYIDYKSNENPSGSTPIVGGTSKYSSYAKSIRRQLGYFGDVTVPLNIQFPQYMDKLDAEYALSQVDETFVGENISYYTSSIISGSVDQYGELVDGGDLIHTGLYKNMGELGNDPGDVDMTDFNYISTGKDNGNLTSMYQFLGFTDPDAGNPESPTYWKNIIPKNYEMSPDFIDGVTTDPEDGLIVSDTQEWTNRPDGTKPYYPVIPKINEMGKFTEDVQGKIPFGEKDNWDDEDIAPITNQFVDGKLEIKLNFSDISSGNISDNSGLNNNGIFISDYRVQYNKRGAPEDQDFVSSDEVDNENGAF